MAIPVLRLDLAPPPTLWRQHHQVLGWAAVAVGSLALAVSVSASVLAYREASLAGRNAILKTGEAKDVIRKQAAIQDRLRAVDIEKDLPLWRLAERILGERSLPWSRLTAELERSLVQDVRLKSIQRNRNASLSVDVKIGGEAKSREAEEAFVASLHQNACFTQVILEREFDRQGGGVEFEYTLPVSATPPTYEALPKYGPARKLPVAIPVKPAPKPMPVPVQPMPAVPVQQPLRFIPLTFPRTADPSAGPGKEGRP